MIRFLLQFLRQTKPLLQIWAYFVVAPPKVKPDVNGFPPHPRSVFIQNVINDGERVKRHYNFSLSSVHLQISVLLAIFILLILRLGVGKEFSFLRNEVGLVVDGIKPGEVNDGFCKGLVNVELSS
ncbi:MAG: hypothetical protein WCH07_03285 [Deltaproteobacteria bacterium]